MARSMLGFVLNLAKRGKFCLFIIVKIIIKIKNQNKISVWIKKDDFNTEEECLTTGQGSDNMLIRTLDKILLKNRIRKSSLKIVEIQGETRGMSALRMIAAAIKEAVSALN